MTDLFGPGPTGKGEWNPDSVPEGTETGDLPIEVDHVVAAELCPVTLTVMAAVSDRRSHYPQSLHDSREVIAKIRPRSCALP
jgi:hypothetical protein